MKQLIWLAVAIGLVAPAAAHAAVIITSDIRVIEGNVAAASSGAAPSAVDGFHDEFAGVNPWIVSDSRAVDSASASAQAYASQLSFLDAGIGFFGALGSAQEIGDADESQGALHLESASSAYLIAFDLTSDYFYHFESNLIASRSGFGSSSSYASVFLLGPLLTEFFDDVQADGTTPSDAGHVLHDGFLASGSYILGMTAASAGTGGLTNAYASFDSAFFLTPAETTAVPEPASITLLGIGLISLARRKTTTGGAL